MYLLDTNIFIEILLEQEKSEDVKKFLAIHDPCELYMNLLNNPYNTETDGHSSFDL